MGDQSGDASGEHAQLLIRRVIIQRWFKVSPDDVVRLILIEVTMVKPDRMMQVFLMGSVHASVSSHEVDVTVVVEIAQRQSAPPTLQVGQSTLACFIHQLALVILEKHQGIPVTCDQ